jgi:hypothetical protein
MVDLRPKNIYNTILEIDEYTKIKENKYYESFKVSQICQNKG